MDGRRSFIRMDGRTGGWTLFYKDGWMDGRRCFIRMVDGRTTLFYKDGWTDDVVL